MQQDAPHKDKQPVMIHIRIMQQDAPHKDKQPVMI
jgi:hypothetical protein